MLAPVKKITFIHDNDPGWIIALWHAIHDGDPAPDAHATMTVAQVNQAATAAIRALAPYLDAGKQKAVVAALGH